jgi:hypothetical protein
MSRREEAVAGPWLAVRFVGGLALLSVGSIHLQQYIKLYSSVPVIGPLFLVNFVGAAIMGIILLAPAARFPGAWGSGLRTLCAVGGIGLAASSLVLLAVSERTPVFGFKEPGYDPAAIAASRAAEVVTVVLLGAYLLRKLLGGTRRITE